MDVRISPLEKGRTCRDCRKPAVFLITATHRGLDFFRPKFSDDVCEAHALDLFKELLREMAEDQVQEEG